MFSYVVTLLDDTEKGILAAETYGKAADKLVTYYGEKNLFTLALTELEDILTKEMIYEEFETQGEN